MKTYKDLVIRAQEILTAHLATQVSLPEEDHAQLVGTMNELIELFDGPAQREVQRLETQAHTAEQLFAIGWNALTEKTYAINVEKGFFAPGRPVLYPDQLLLIICEICEGYEHHRKGRKDDKLTHRDGLEVELADSVIRTMNFAKHCGYDLPAAIAEKSAFNSKRPYLHGDTYKPESETKQLPVVKNGPPLAKPEGKVLRTGLSQDEKHAILEKYHGQTVDFSDGFYFDSEDKAWLHVPELWELL